MPSSQSVRELVHKVGNQVWTQMGLVMEPYSRKVEGDE